MERFSCKNGFATNARIKKLLNEKWKITVIHVQLNNFSSVYFPWNFVMKSPCVPRAFLCELSGKNLKEFRG
jgi:hypothetical protein